MSLPQGRVVVLPESAREPRRSREVLLENATPHEHRVAWCARPYLPMAPENDRPGRFPNGTGRTTLARLPPPRKETATTALTAAAGATPMAQPRPLPDECLCGLRGRVLPLPSRRRSRTTARSPTSAWPRTQLSRRAWRTAASPG